MKIPRENSLAFFPPHRAAGNADLAPLTLAGAVKLAHVGVEFDKPVSKDALFRSAWILSGETVPFVKFCKRFRGGLKALSKAVEDILNDAAETFVEAPRGKGPATITPHGLGWPLELAEFLCAEYGWSFADAIATPVATAYALCAACRQRNGGKHKGLDYIEREYAKKLKAKARGEGEVKAKARGEGEEKAK